MQSCLIYKKSSSYGSGSLSWKTGDTKTIRTKKNSPLSAKKVSSSIGWNGRYFLLEIPEVELFTYMGDLNWGILLEEKRYLGPWKPQ
ncbi:hypothetical protein AYI70_g7795 [Smittium culicis]|uniref:Uncharacterized protein n=1 Tax=Smittium culicis TaxID=133412 RepID=A0A1R1XIV2_9FUNG|nr:hypothetical protein AYI70_g7795 [Smittium culicis]